MDYDSNKPLWKDPQFPHFFRNQKHLEPLESSIKKLAHELSQKADSIDVSITEMLASSAIEGVVLSVEKLTSSYLGNIAGPSGKRESNAVAAMRLAKEHFSHPLSHQIIKKINTLFNEELNAGRYVGGVSIVKAGILGRDNVVEHGAPPEMVESTMDDFLKAFNEQKKSTPLFNAICGHIHFEKIHPFSDGNGRTGRVLMQMALMRDLSINHPVALSRSIERHKEIYYSSIKNASMDLTATIKEMAPMMEQAFRETMRMAELTEYRKKANAIETNQRQRKALEHLIKAELQTGYLGKFTSSKYETLTKTSESTALRDLRQLVQIGLLVKNGILKGSHYTLPLGKDAP